MKSNYINNFAMGSISILLALGIGVFSSLYVNDYNNSAEDVPQLQSVEMGLNCVGSVQISIGPSGIYELTELDFLQNNPGPGTGPYSITIINPPIGGNIVDCSLIDQDIMVQVLDQGTGEICMSTAKIRDKMPPLLNCEPDTVSCNFDIWEMNLDLLTVSFTDNCTDSTDLDINFINDTIENFACTEDTAFLRRIVRRWLVTDNKGMTSTCHQEIWIERTPTSEIDFPADTIIQCGTPFTLDDVGQPMIDSMPISDYCQIGITETRDTIPKCGEGYIIFREWMAMSMCMGDMTMGEQMVMVIDTTPPVITCPEADTVGTDSDICGVEYTVPNFEIFEDCGDDEDQLSILYYLDGNLQTDRTFRVDTGDHVVQIVVVNDCGLQDTCEYDLRVEDDDTPLLVCSQDVEIILPADGSPLLVNPYVFIMSLTDNCSMNFDVQVQRNTAGCGMPADGPFQDSLTVCCDDVGGLTITIMATDQAGNSAMCMATVDVIDDTAPTITCPDPIVVLNDPGLCEADVTVPAPTVNDNCGTADLSISNDYNGTADASDIYPVGVTTVTFTVEDGSGNSATCSFTVEVEDREPPVITDCPGDQDVALNENCEFVLEDYTPDVVFMDNCAGAGMVTVTQTPAPGSTLTDTTTVTIIVEDNNGNSSICSFDVNPSDMTPPTITNCPMEMDVDFDENCEYTIPDFSMDPMFEDNCTDEPNLIITQTPPAGTIIMDTTTVTIIAEDEAGNTATCSFDINPSDNTPPQNVVCPADQDVDLDANCEYVMEDFTGMVTFDDNCTEPGMATITQNPTAGTVITDTTTVTITVTDGAGNTATCTFTVNPSDNTPPTNVVCPADQDVNFDENCEYVMEDFTGLVSFDDNCSDTAMITITQTPTVGTVITDTTTVTITVTDQGGNSASCTFDVNPSDNTAPTLTCPGVQDVELNDSCVYIMEDFTGMATYADNCTAFGDIIVSQNPPAGTEITDTISVTITVEDEAGNIASCPFTVNPSDNQNPLIIDCPSDHTIDPNGDCVFILNDYRDSITVEDNCGVDPADITQSPPPGDTINMPTIVEILVVDVNGNSSICEFTVTPADTDTVPPILTVPADEKFFLNGDTCEFPITLAPAIASGCCPIDTIYHDSPFADVQGGPDASGLYPSGKHMITFTVEDTCGHVVTDSTMIVVIPLDRLEFFCIDLDTLYMFGIDTTVYARELIKFTTIDQCNPDEITISFDLDNPNDTSKYVNCDSLNANGAYTYDEKLYLNFAGCLIDSCETEFVVYDWNDSCDLQGGLQGITGEVHHWNDEVMKGVEVDLNFGHKQSKTNKKGAYEFENINAGRENFMTADMDDDPLNGVTTMDVYRIHRHLSGEEELHDPYKILAADVNMSLDISQKDITMLKRLLLRLDEGFPDEKEWLFVPDYMEGYELMDDMEGQLSGSQGNSTDRRFVYILPPTEGNHEDKNFIGVKKGDVNGTAELNKGLKAWDKQPSTEIEYVVEGNKILLKLTEDSEIGAMQFELVVYGAEVSELKSDIPGFDKRSFVHDNQSIRLSMVMPEDMKLEKGTTLFEIGLKGNSNSGNLNAMLALDNYHLGAEVYRGEETRSIELRTSKVAEDNRYALYQNRPNPFRGSSEISFSLAKDEVVNLSIIDLSGNEIFTRKIAATAGINTVEIRKSELPSEGVYFYRLQSEEFTAMKKMLLMN